MISQNQVKGLSEKMTELDRLSNIETAPVSNEEIDTIFNNDKIEEEV